MTYMYIAYSAYHIFVYIVVYFCSVYVYERISSYATVSPVFVHSTTYLLYSNCCCCCLCKTCRFINLLLYTCVNTIKRIMREYTKSHTHIHRTEYMYTFSAVYITYWFYKMQFPQYTHTHKHNHHKSPHQCVWSNSHICIYIFSIPNICKVYFHFISSSLPSSVSVYLNFVFVVHTENSICTHIEPIYTI